MAPVFLIHDAIMETRHEKAPTFFIEDKIMPSSTAAFSQLDETCNACKASMEKPSNTPSTYDVDDEMTTDVGQTSASEAESSSGLSGNECKRAVVRRSRFGTTKLETIPGTPSAGVHSMGSPPGLSRAAMREARDVCRREAIPARKLDMKSNITDVSALESGVDGTVTFSENLCRFSATQLGTVPKTPTSVSKWKAIAKGVGSPPGLSRAEMRSARDALKGAGIAWGACNATKDACTPPSGFAKRRSAASTTLIRMKQEAALLKNVKSATDIDEKDALDAAQSSSSDGESFCEMETSAVRRCSFDVTSLGTIPSSPVGACASPPGLSRKAMRQARDTCKAESAATTAASWGTAEALTITPAEKLMTRQASEVKPVASQEACVGCATQLPR